MVANARQEVAEAIRERTGEDVGAVLSDACLAQYATLDEAERQVRLELAIERVLLWKDLRALPEEARAEARSKLATVRKLLESPRLAAVTSGFMEDVARLEAIADPEEFVRGCPLPSVAESEPSGG